MHERLFMTKTQHRRWIIPVLGSLMTISPFSIDLYLPSFTQIARDLQTSPNRVALTIATYFFGLAVGQTIYGPLLDRFGRKTPIYIGLFIYILASLGCAQSQTINQLLIFRFIQALGGCSAMVASLTMVRDFFDIERMAKIISMLMLILAVSPLLAPTVGGWLIVWFSWRIIFYVLVGIAVVVMLGVHFLLPVTYEPDRDVVLKIKPIFKTFVTILKNPKFFTYSFAGAFSFASLFVYVAGSPFIFMDLYGVSPQRYGMVFALLTGGVILGTQLNVFLLRTFKSVQIFKTMVIIRLVISLVFLFIVLFVTTELRPMMFLFFISLFSLGVAFPNASAIALSPFTKNLGSASSLIEFLQITIGGIASTSVGFFTVKSVVPLVSIMAASAILSCGFLLVGLSKLRKSSV